MNLRLFALSLAAVLTGVLVVTAPLAAQNMPATPTPPATEVSIGSLHVKTGGSGSASSITAKDTAFSLEVRNGMIVEDGKPTKEATVGNILEILQRQPVKFNLALGPGVAKVKIGDLVMRMDEMDIGEVAEALASSSNEIVANSQNQTGNVLWSLSLKPQADREVAVLNLTNYLNPNNDADDKTVETKLSALTDIIFKTLKDMDPQFSDANQPHYQFHKGANLLVVTGTHEDVTVAQQITGALTQQTPNTLANLVAKLAATDPAAATSVFAKLSSIYQQGVGTNPSDVVDALTNLKTREIILYIIASLNTRLDSNQNVSPAEVATLQQILDEVNINPKDPNEAQESGHDLIRDIIASLNTRLESGKTPSQEEILKLQTLLGALQLQDSSNQLKAIKPGSTP